MNDFLLRYTHDWYDGLNDAHHHQLKNVYFYMYLEGIDDSDLDDHF